MEIKNLCYISIVLLVIAIIGGMPYGYYKFLRLFIFATSCIYLYKNKENKSNFIYSWFVLGLIYNPIIPIYLSKDIWCVINIVSIVYLVFYLLKNKKHIL